MLYLKIAFLVCFVISAIQFIFVATRFHVMYRGFNFTDANNLVGKMVAYVGEMIVFGIGLILITINPFS